MSVEAKMQRMTFKPIDVQIQLDVYQIHKCRLNVFDFRMFKLYKTVLLNIIAERNLLLMYINVNECIQLKINYRTHVETKTRRGQVRIEHAK